LPHWEVEDGRYFVTIHLAGAIPKQGQDRIRALATELDSTSNSGVQAELRIQRRIYAEMESWLDRTEYASHLTHQQVAEMVIEAIIHRHGRAWNMIDYVVMPSHLHLFFELISPGLKTCLEQFKRWTGHEAQRILGGDHDRFWQDEWFDHWSRSDEEDERIIDYIHQNPVKAKLVERAEEWLHGSLSRGRTSKM
jgi:type I restriction enzyme R subunit/putative DNA methylase